MALQIKVIRGKKYVYDVKSFWDKELKKYRKKTVYMGLCINEVTREFAPKKRVVVKTSNDRQIVNFGDTNILWHSLQKSKLSSLFADILPGEADCLNALLFHKIIDGGACENIKHWYEGNYAKILFPHAKVDFQGISEFFFKLGNEEIQHKFFKRYLTEIASISGGVVIDSTGIENAMDIPLAAYCGKNEQNEQNETKMIMVVDRISHIPLYFRLMADNTVDVSTLKTTFNLMKKFGLTPSFAVMDAGYYSSDNLKSLYKAKIPFLSRIPADRKLYNEIIEKTNATLEKPENIVLYNERSLYVQKVKAELYGHVGYAYVCCDIKQKDSKIDKFIKDSKDDNLSNGEIAAQIPYIGKFILLSNKELDSKEVLPLYYTRQITENTFGFSKSKLELLPLRVHNLQTLKGYIFLNYLALILSLEIQTKLKGLCTLHEALLIGRNQFCEIFDRDFIPLEPNKQLMEIYRKLDIMAVNNSED